MGKVVGGVQGRVDPDRAEGGTVERNLLLGDQREGFLLADAP